MIEIDKVEAPVRDNTASKQVVGFAIWNYAEGQDRQSQPIEVEQIDFIGKCDETHSTTLLISFKSRSQRRQVSFGALVWCYRMRREEV